MAELTDGDTPIAGAVTAHDAAPLSPVGAWRGFGLSESPGRGAGRATSRRSAAPATP